jgi:2-oxoisovalerate dehydrogenase E1 component alpha subunit
VNSVARFEIRRIQYLDEQAQLAADAPPLANDRDMMTDLYRAMSRVRAFDAKAINLQRTGKLGTYASSLGHEAIHVGAARALEPDDVFAPTYREHGVLLERGVKMSEILSYWGGDETGMAWSGPARDFPYCIPIATQTLHAAGAAFAIKHRGERRCALAALVFLVINNRYAISVPVEKQTGAGTLAQKAIAGGVPGTQVDGNDIIAVCEVVTQAAARARRGEGPSLIEALTYRIGDHTTADDAGRYRDAKEVEHARQVEPVIRLRRYLTARGWWDDSAEQELQRECETRVAAAVATYFARPDPDPAQMFMHLFARLPARLEEQLDTVRISARRAGAD